MGARTFILENTVVASPFLCPEIKLRLVTDSCPLWRANERDLAALKIPDPYWAFCWAGGQALARHLLDQPSLVCDLRVIDFGAGGGVVAIAAAMAGARTVLAADIDPFAAEAVRLNAELNGVALEVTTRDLAGDPCSGWEVLLAGDVCYYEKFTRRLIPWFTILACRGAAVLLSDPGRGYLGGEFLEPLIVYQAPADIDIGGRSLRPTTVYRVLNKTSR